ncbi:MAG: NADH-quinone oxidoreductase subunit H [Pseudomonadota bacterium]
MNWDLVASVLLVVLQSVVVLVGLLIMVAFLLLFDRKVWAAVQLRKGPNVVGPFGLFQSFADLLKFVLKEPIIPAGANRALFLLAPVITGTLSLAAWAVIPFQPNWVVANLNVGILYIFAISSLGVYGIIMGGWASNSKYAFLGALRSAAQMVSYEVSIGFVLVCVLLWVGSLNLSDIVMAQAGPYGMLHWHFINPLLFPMFIVFFISALAETNRLFMLGEYVAIVLMCALTVILFLGGWLPPIPVAPFTWVPGILWFIIKVWIVFFMFAMVKAFVPRYRYDQLMRLGWKVFLPLTLVMLVLTAAFLQIMGWAPGAAI